MEPPSDSELLDLARAARTTAYAPYSRLRVGAAVATAEGRVFTGANVENASHAAGMCAERLAVCQAVVADQRDLSSIAVVADGPGPCTPCGICRQVLHEFSPEIRVLASGDDGSVRVYELAGDLLPDAFGPGRLRA